jgi:hypothetical protein
MMRNVVRIRITAWLLGMLSICCNYDRAQADGGRLIRVERTHGWTVSIFAAPDPPRAGTIDVSVLVQEEASGTVVADAEIAVTLTSQSDPSIALSAPASRQQATNKLLQSALLVAPSAGDWLGTIHCSAGSDKAEIPFALHVNAAPPAWTKVAPWFLWPLAAAMVFVAHRTLARKRIAFQPPAPPGGRSPLR